MCFSTKKQSGTTTGTGLLENHPLQNVFFRILIKQIDLFRVHREVDRFIFLKIRSPLRLAYAVGVLCLEPEHGPVSGHALESGGKMAVFIFKIRNILFRTFISYNIQKTTFSQF